MKNTKIMAETKTILKKSWKEFTLKFLLSMVIRALLMILPLLYSDAINEATKTHYDKAYQFIFISIILTVIYYIVEWINQYCFYALYNKLYRNYTRLASFSTVNNSMYSLSRFTLGEYTNIINNDIDVISAFFANGVLRIVRLFEFLIIYWYFFTLNFYIFLITIIISLVMLGYLLHSGKKTQEYNRMRKSTLDSQTSLIHEIFNGIKEIKGFNVFTKMNQRMKNSCFTYLKSNAKYNIFYNKVKYITLGMIEIFRLLLVFYSIYLVQNGQLEIGVVLLIYTYYQKIIDNFSTISTITVEYQNLKVSLKRMNKLLEYRKVQENVISKECSRGNIIFKDVLYGNREDPILNNVSFEIKENSITVITGKAGSGKTGIFDLLLKMNERHKGEILIDGIDINYISSNYYYDLISSVRKQPVFFDISIKDNFLMIDDNFEKAKEICKMLQIDSYIQSLSNGYDTSIYSHTDNISNRVKILIAIARVFLKNSKIMLFDETISMLEKDDQELVLNFLGKLKDFHTIIIISREVDVLKKADQIIVMEQNKVKEFGLSKDLIKKKGIFYRLYQNIE